MQKLITDICRKNFEKNINGFLAEGWETIPESLTIEIKPYRSIYNHDLTHERYSIVLKKNKIEDKNISKLRDEIDNYISNGWEYINCQRSTTISKIGIQKMFELKLYKPTCQT